MYSAAQLGNIPALSLAEVTGRLRPHTSRWVPPLRFLQRPTGGDRPNRAFSIAASTMVACLASRSKRFQLCRSHYTRNLSTRLPHPLALPCSLPRISPFHCESCMSGNARSGSSKRGGSTGEACPSTPAWSPNHGMVGSNVRRKHTFLRRGRFVADGCCRR